MPEMASVTLNESRHPVSRSERHLKLHEAAGGGGLGDAVAIGDGLGAVAIADGGADEDRAPCPGVG